MTTTGVTSSFHVALLEAFPEPVLLVGTDRRIRNANAAARELFGQALANAQVFSCIRQPEATQAIEQGLRAMAEPVPRATVFEANKLMISNSAERVWRMQVAVLRSEDAEPCLVITLRDISHVEEAEQQRRDFVANVSHEMRSPLTVLLGFIETLRGPARDDPEARARFLDIMEREAQRMTRLVTDLLSLSKVESDEKVRPRGQVSVAEVLRATLAALRPQIEAAGIVVALDDAAAVEPIPGDRDQLLQVFNNLVENALKYGGAGERIEIDVVRLTQVPGLTGPVLRISVTDHGDGIDPIHLPRLTERFYRVDGHRSRQMGGTGLGLAIVKHIVNRHRGRLAIRSARGEGSTFTVLLPCG